MAALVNLHDLFVNLLKDVYYAEKKVLKSLPKMEKAVGKGSTLALSFAKHYDETAGQVARLEKVFELIGERPRAKTCPAMDGLIKESMEIMEDTDNRAVLEASLLADSQAVEHYEIARYGTLITWAAMLGYDKAVRLLQETLIEEKTTDSIMTEMAEREINEAALHAEKIGNGKGRTRAMAERVGSRKRHGAGARVATAKKRGRANGAESRSAMGSATAEKRAIGKGRPRAASARKRPDGRKRTASAKTSRSSSKRASSRKSAGGRGRRRSSTAVKR